MNYPYVNAVCRGSVSLGNHCGRCERCHNEMMAIEAITKDPNRDPHKFLSVGELTQKMKDLQKQGIDFTKPQVAIKLDSQSAPSPIAGHVQGLPVAGYAAKVEQWKIDMVNENKILEEKVLRRVDEHVRPRGDESIDGASVQLARRHVEDAFYRLNRAIMQPKRINGDL